MEELSRQGQEGISKKPQEEGQSEVTDSQEDQKNKKQKTFSSPGKGLRGKDEGMLPRRQEQPEPGRRAKEEGRSESQGKLESEGSPVGKPSAEDCPPRKVKRKTDKGLAHCSRSIKRPSMKYASAMRT